MHNKKSKTDKQGLLLIITVILIMIIGGAISAAVIHTESKSEQENIIYTTDNKIKNYESAKEYVNNYAKANNLSLDDYPDSLIELLGRNSETKDFVLSYPKENDKLHKVNLKEYKNCKSVPLFMQWDKRWGYTMYGDDVAGLTGCGPVCLSMVAVYILQDTKYSPDYMIEWAKENGYCINGKGSLWTLISEGGEKLGLDVTEIPLDEQRIINNLEVGNPIICIMGPGDFTTTGHFIVMTGYENGKIKINDPNSYANSEKEWNYDDICNQINNLWVIR